LGEERILLGKIAEGGRSEPLNSCFCLRQLRAKRSSGGFRPKSFCEFGGKEKARRAISFFVFSFKNAPAISQKLTETSIKRSFITLNDGIYYKMRSFIYLDIIQFFNGCNYI